MAGKLPPQTAPSSHWASISSSMAACKARAPWASGVRSSFWPLSCWPPSPPSLSGPSSPSSWSETFLFELKCLITVYVPKLGPKWHVSLTVSWSFSDVLSPDSGTSSAPSPPWGPLDPQATTKLLSPKLSIAAAWSAKYKEKCFTCSINYQFILKENKHTNKLQNKQSTQHFSNTFPCLVSPDLPHYLLPDWDQVGLGLSVLDWLGIYQCT